MFRNLGHYGWLRSYMGLRVIGKLMGGILIRDLASVQVGVRFRCKCFIAVGIKRSPLAYFGILGV